MWTSRRAFIGSVVAAVASSRKVVAQGGLDQFGGAGLPCAADVLATPAAPPAANYRPGAPWRQTLDESGPAGGRFALTGVVAGLSCGPISGATLEFWQADRAGVYDTAGFRLRGRQLTDAAGRYRLVTIVPGATPGQAPQIGVHVIVPGKAELWTALFFSDDPANVHDPRYQAALALTLTGSGPIRSATFDIRLNL